MKKPSFPLNESERLINLQSYDILDTAQEAHFDEITKTAAELCDCKIALISLIDKDRQWFKSKHGLSVNETARDISYCGHAILNEELFIVEDATKDDRFCDNPLLINAPNVRFYAGAPLKTPGGYIIGTLCVIDSNPKTLNKEQRLMLKSLASQVVSYLELRKNNLQQMKLKNELEEKLLEINDYNQVLNKNAIIARTDTAGNITYVNDLFCEISGYEVEELIGKNHRMINSGIHSKDFFKNMWDTISSGKIWRGEIRNRAKDGSLYWVDSTLLPIKDHFGKTKEYLAIRYNITDKKETEYLYNETQKIAKIGGWVLNVNTMETQWTDETYKIHELEIGTKVNASQGISFYEEEERPKLEQYITTCINEGTPFESDFKFITAKGNKRWVHSKGTPEFDLNGKVIRLFGTFQDITEQKKLEQELKDSNRKLDLAHEGTGLGIWTWKIQEQKIKFDKRLAAMLGYEAIDHEISESQWELFVHRDDLKQCKTDLKNYLEKKTNRYENIHRMRHKNGHWVFVMDRGRFSEWDAYGNPTQITGTYIDITKLKKAQQEAKQAEVAKSEFLANMSHEIRTPLNGIIGMAQLLQTSDFNNEQQEMIDTVSSSSETLLSLVNDILDISKIESGKIELEKVNFNLHDCIKEAAHLLDAKASQNNTYIQNEFPQKEPLWFIGDVTRIRQIIINYLANAVKFTKNGKITIGYKVVSQNQKNSWVKIYVKDTGVGIPKEAESKLFKSFVQADSSITRKFGGTGLGLAICSKLAQLMKGKVSFESELHIGSTFYVEIPLKPGVPETRQFETIKNADRTTAKEYPHNILVAEDNEVNQRVINLLLKRLGYNPTLVATGVEVLEELKKKEENHYSIILMDMQMPELDGVSATKKVIQIYGNKAPKIIALTANAFNSDKEKCLAAGMVDFLQKPLKKETLAKTLIKFHDNSKQQASA